jgi:RHS repeat-associated protein
MYGVQTDPNSLLYMKARYYNPFLCRFINPDPTGFSGGMNFYAFANGNPISLIDPFGLGFWSVTGHFLEGAAVAVGVGVVVAIAAPEIVAGGAVALGWAGLEAATATTASTAIVTGGLGVTAVVGATTTTVDIAHNANAGNWDNVAFDAGTLSGGFLFGGLGGGRYIADNVSPKPSTVPPSWNPFTADYVSTPTAPNGSGFMRNPNLPLTTDLYNWLGTGPTPTSGGTSAALSVSGLSAGFDLYTGQNPVDWLGNPVSSSTTGKPY